MPGMDEAVWYLTSVPCAEDAADGEAIGLKVRPSWWHNWPRIHYPSLSYGPGAYVPALDLADGKQAAASKLLGITPQALSKFLRGMEG